MDTLDFAAPQIYRTRRAERTESPSVLVVDDDRAFCELLVEFLDESGYRVRAAVDGLEAFRLVDPQIGEDEVFCDIDLVILDMSMPRMTGLEFAAHLRSWSLKTPIIAMTAFPDATFYRSAYELGCIAAFAKPFSFVQLLNYTDEFFDR